MGVEPPGWAWLIDQTNILCLYTWVCDATTGVLFMRGNYSSHTVNHQRKVRRVMSNAVADILDRAADYIDEHGWCQDRLRDESGQVCLYGALESVGAPHSDLGEAHWLVCHELKSPVSLWNDKPGRTQNEVTDLLRTVAKQQRGEVK